MTIDLYAFPCIFFSHLGMMGDGLVLLPLIPGASLSLRLRLGLLVVRPSHLCRGATTSTLNGTGQLVEALLEAQGWGGTGGKSLENAGKFEKREVYSIV